MSVYGSFKCPVDHQKYVVTDENLQQVTEHMRKHWKYEHVDEEWIKSKIRPETGVTSESTTEETEQE